jgi:hypothetical protein
MADQKPLVNQVAEHRLQGIGAGAGLADHVARRYAAMVADVIQNLDGQFGQRRERIPLRKHRLRKR